MCAKQDAGRHDDDFDNENALIEHYQSQHTRQLKDEDIAVLTRYSRKPGLSACLICGSSVGIATPRAGESIRIAAQGQEDILRSISCIPWQFGRSLDARSSQAQATNEAQSLSFPGESSRGSDDEHDISYDADGNDDDDDNAQGVRPITRHELEAPDLQPLASQLLVSGWMTGVRRSDPQRELHDAYRSTDEVVARRVGRPRAYAFSGGGIQPPSFRYSTGGTSTFPRRRPDTVHTDGLPPTDVRPERSRRRVPDADELLDFSGASD
ncbi:hypothetical protein LTR86_008978 [Recurvomyces mirabilis]|nr:hypothetical protein LTR86_008978 [Recurvomyces mirabilis]